MTSGIVFILHDPADGPYATELAEALTSHSAFPVALGADAAQRPTQYGAGATCVVLWTKNAAGIAAAASEALGGSFANALVCRLGDAPMPAQFAAAALVHVREQVSAIEIAPQLSDAITRAQGAERNASPRRGAAPSLTTRTYRPVSTGEPVKQHMAMRSAVGLVATMAVAGVAAPMIGGRAGATNITPDQEPLPASGVTVASAPVEAIAPAVNTAGQVIQVAAHAPVARPARDPLEVLILAEPDAIAMAHEETVAPEVTFAMLDATALDPKTSQVIASMIAGADVGDWRIAAVAPLPLAQQDKPDTAPLASKESSGA